jgi:nucleoside-diphosphate-sugar epimerase
MKVLVTGGAGMLGRKFCERLAKDGVLAGQRVTRLLMSDVIAPSRLADAPFDVESSAGDLSEPHIAERLVADRPDVIFHLAAIVSGEAEADFDKGYRTNLSGTQQLFEALRHAGYKPRLVFASSIAVFGAPFPEVIAEEFFTTPLTSYGTQKAICELLLADYTRRGIFDGIGLRLPTICVRPGKPNKAASGFFSNIIREPLRGEEAVGFLCRAAEIDSTTVGARRNLTMPGVSATVAEMIESMQRVAGLARARLIRREPDPFIRRLVDGWPRNFDASRALSLGFKAETRFSDIIRAHIEDEHGGII